ncbi:nitroreductase [Luteolibacter flavescens]|uniref:Nitroreductase n=1 Tax=Luteolibacter flavescens TaxID=1859460 RepID=A0ABT3FMX9_9BACT|nr:nitroreductase family protein [Luteolibacter flavescens]MCW1884926.1 nitroreductase [Luteolibacter flavescens]
MNRRKMLLMGAAVPALAGCEKRQPEKVTYEGSSRDAIIDNMMTRRSIRKYTTEQVSQEQLDVIMRCAIYAPSALNKQPWEMRVVQNPDILAEVNKRFLRFAQGKEFQGSAARYREPGFSIFHSAPTLIVIAGDKDIPTATLDIGITLQNILLSAAALGLGTCPLGSLVPILNLPENADLLKLMNIPTDHQVTINVALGHAAESPTAPIRYSDRVKIIR